MSFIDSPDLEALAAAMESTDPVKDIYRPAAREVADGLGGELTRALRQAGASEGLRDDVGTYEPEGGETYVGVPGSSQHAGEMQEIEYGTAMHAPDAPLRKTVMGRQGELDQEFSDALDRHLGKIL